MPRKDRLVRTKFRSRKSASTAVRHFRRTVPKYKHSVKRTKTGFWLHSKRKRR